MPLANAFIDEAQLGRPDPTFPLEAVRCAACGLVQLTVVVDPTILFKHYLYSSSASMPQVAHFDILAGELVDRFAQPDALVVEFGSNDGILLRPLKRRGVRVLGVEPSENLSAAANSSGLETWNDFFTSDVAGRIVTAKGKAAVVVANNVLAHIDDLGDVARGLATLLDTGGVFVAEFPYLHDLLEHVEYDTIYHEHLSYLSLHPLIRLFEAVDLEAFDVTRLSVHGGSLRLFVGRRGRWARSASLQLLLDQEEDWLRDPAIYERFAHRVSESRSSLLRLLDHEQSAGHTIAALGATAKGNTLLNYCGIGRDRIAWIADSTPAKVGMYSPGMHLPVREERTLNEEAPGRTLLLAWNYADAIVARSADYLREGGRFIHPIPLAHLIP